MLWVFTHPFSLNWVLAFLIGQLFAYELGISEFSIGDPGISAIKDKVVYSNE